MKTEKIMKIASQTVTEKTIEQKMQQLLKQNNSMHSVAKPKIVYKLDKPMLQECIIFNRLVKGNIFNWASTRIAFISDNLSGENVPVNG